MISRALVGATALIAISATLAATATAQERLRDRLMQRQAQPSDPVSTPITAAGDYRFRFDHGGMTREYIVHMPARALKGGPAPILVALHGGGGNMDYQASNYGLKEKSDAAGFIAVFPNGFSRLGGKLATWNAGSCCAGAVRNRVDDVGFLREVVARVVRQANGDRSRVFFTGMSNGAMMSYRMACDAPDLARAIAPVAGTDNTLSCERGRLVPVIHFHAKDDPMVPFTGGVGKDSFLQQSFVSVPATMAKWVRRNRASPAAKTVLSIPGATCQLHSGKAPVELCITESGGHSWPGTTSRRPGKAPSQAISANDLMWAFFQTV